MGRGYTRNLLHDSRLEFRARFNVVAVVVYSRGNKVGKYLVDGLWCKQ